MKLSSYFVREEQSYSKSTLFKKFCLTEDVGEKLVAQLQKYGILTATRESSGETAYKFTFVGIIFFKDFIIRCYPKYIRSTDTPDKAFIQVMNVLRCSGRESNAEYHPGGESEYMEFSLISAALALLEDYAEHGLYANTVHDCEYNGSGEILWEKTLGSVEPFFCNDTPLYLDFHTKRSVDDTSDYVTRLHKHILKECSQLLEEAGLLSLVSLGPLRLSDEPREHFGPDDAILQRLRAELDIQFDCQKQALLRLLIRFMEQRESWSSQPLHLYGTTNFEIVWEKVCARVFGNQLNLALKKLPLPSGLAAGYSPGKTLMQLIDKPMWHLAGLPARPGPGTLIPDIAAFHPHGEKTVFVILDAKYYTYSHLPEKMPSIGDIDKQFLYELAFKSFLKAHGICHVQNIFLLPTEGEQIEYKGHVEFAIFKALSCENIKIVLVPAQKMYALYLQGQAQENFASTLLEEVYQYSGGIEA